MTTTTVPKPLAPRRSDRRIQIFAGSSRHTGLVALAWIGVVIAVVLATGLQTYQLGQLTNAVIIATAIVGLNTVTGYTGLLSIGHSAFLGVGAYTTAVMVTKFNYIPLITIPVAIVLGAILGAVIGMPSIRIRGLYLAMVTLALAVAFPQIIEATEGTTGGASGISINLRFLAPPTWTGLTLVDRPLWIFLLSLASLGVCMAVVWCIQRSRLGEDMRAVRDHETAAQSFGINVARTKIIAFTISGALTGLAGSMFAMYVGALSPAGSFTILKAIELISGLVLGGVATQLGPLAGAAVVVYLPIATSGFIPGQGSGVLFGVLLIVMVYFMPEGIVGRLNGVWRSRVEFIPRGHPLLSTTSGSNRSEEVR